MQLQSNRQSSLFTPSAPPAPYDFQNHRHNGNNNVPSISSPICSPPTGLAVISLNNNNQAQILAQKSHFNNNNNNNNLKQQAPPSYPNARNSVINPLSSANFNQNQAINLADRKPEVGIYLFF